MLVNSDALSLQGVLFLPKFQYNRIFVSRLPTHNFVTTKFDSHGCFIQDQVSDAVIAWGRVEGNLYILDGQTVRSSTLSSFTASNICIHDIEQLWHQRLGHAFAFVMKQISCLCDCNFDSLSISTECFQAKEPRTPPFPRSVSQSDAIFDLIHVDLWGPYK